MPPQPSTPNRPWRTLLPAAALLAVIAAIYLPGTLHVPFLWDDIDAIVRNDRLQPLWPPDANFWSYPDTTLAGRPLLAFTFAVNFALHGLNIPGYHLINVALHASCALAWLTLLTRVLRLAAPSLPAVPLAFCATLLWSVHPLVTQPVAYLVQRGELLVSLFYILTLLTALRAMQSANARTLTIWTTLAALCNLLGVATKEVMITAPLAVLAMDHVLFRLDWRTWLRRRAALYASLALGWAFAAALYLNLPRGQSVGAHLGITPWQYLTTQAGVLLHYLRLALWPSGLVFFYDWPVATQFSTYALPGLLILLALAVTVRGLYRRRPWSLPPVFFFLVLAPTSSFIPIVTELAAERRMYLPLAALISGLISTLFWTLSALPAARSSPSRPLRLTVAFTALATILLAFTTTRRLDVYQDAVTLWRDVITKNPDNEMAYDALGVELLDRRDYPGAYVAFRTAIKLEPRFANAVFNMGTLQEARGDLPSAEAFYRRAAELRPHYAAAHGNLGVILFRTNHLAEAQEQFRLALAADPNHARSAFNLGYLLYQQNRFSEALPILQHAAQLDPQRMDCHYYLGLTFKALHDSPRAAAAFQRVLELDPTHANAAAALAELKP